MQITENKAHLLIGDPVSHLTARLRRHRPPVAGVVDHGGGVQQSVAEPVANIAADAVCRPVMATEVLLLCRQHHNVLHVAPAEVWAEEGGRGK